MDGYESLSEYGEKEIKHGLSLMKKMGSANTTGYSSDCSCSDCANTSDSSDGCYSGNCSCSECADSSDCDGAAVCALKPKPRKITRKKNGQKTGARRQQQKQSCRGGVCPLVRKPKKAPAKSKKVVKKTAKKSPRGRKSPCYCCYDCC